MAAVLAWLPRAWGALNGLSAAILGVLGFRALSTVERTAPWLTAAALAYAAAQFWKRS